MSSCSSNGFKSYPRRQCCTTVRFLMETDLKGNPTRFPSKRLRRSLADSKLTPKQPSMMQKASDVMIKALKRLQFAGVGVSTPAKLLPRSFSRKLLKHGFWKKNDYQNNNEVKRLTTFGDLIKLEEVATLSSVVNTTTSTDITNSISSSSNNNSSSSSSNSSSNSNSNNNNSNNDVTDDNLEVKLDQDVLLEKEKTNGNRVGVTTVTAIVNNYSDANEDAKKWQVNQDEQFSPVSVMDFPSDNDVDEEDEVSSISPCKHLNVKGTKISTHKTRISDRIPQLEPVKLEDRIAQSVLESSTTPFLDFAQEENQIDKKAMALLLLLKSMVPFHHLLKYDAEESLLLDFFKESTHEENVSDYDMLQRAKNWMDGQEQDISIDWQCENNRQTYLRGIEKGVKWSNYDHQVEKVNVGLEVECEIFASLVNDVLTEFSLQEFD
ncbi:hypothetical protein M8C21_005707 [Ambrosia artemisiifolia]|uniref:DUF4378 domain-containing protein n=1 Tax=Ambrosia artemisiifolia TaxID=4212 RepID=A0AAD5D951_AMBAR|nr:hypothetical protein M8C21_005707 [Ambrosia artemisiifolia]